MRPYRREIGFTSLGNPYAYTVFLVPRVTPEILNCVVYLFESVEAAELGTAPGGTGFLTYCGDVWPGHFYVVTAGHVVKAGATVVRLNTKPQGGEPAGSEAISITTWLPGDPDDLAVAPIEPPDEYRHDIAAIPMQAYLDEDQATEGVIGVGDECLIPGRFLRHQGGDRNRPLIRFGNVAAWPAERIHIERLGHSQESVFIEARSLSGYSGSPVFAYQGARISEDSMWVEPGTEPTRFWFLGVDYLHFNDFAEVVGADRKTPVSPTQFAKEHSGFAAVIPAWRVCDLLNADVLRRQREENEEMWEKERPSDTEAELDTSTSESEFERFDDLTHKLANTPKSEVDELRKKESG